MADNTIDYLSSPFGMVTIEMLNESLRLSLSTTQYTKAINSNSHPLIHLAAYQLNQYFTDPKCTISTVQPIESIDGTPYQRRVWQAIAAIPSGETRSYSEVAESINSCPRAVANACGANKLPILIPCHRVVAKQGIGGFMRGNTAGLSIKRWLLSHEGIHDA